MLLNLCTAVFDANCRSVSVTSSPFIVPKDPPKTEVKDEDPHQKDTKADAPKLDTSDEDQSKVENQEKEKDE